MSKVNGMLVRDINTVLTQKIIQEKSALSTKILNYTNYQFAMSNCASIPIIHTI